jgi:hypothetical protein
MKWSLKYLPGRLWSRPDPVLAEAGIAGELFVAKIRTCLAAILLLIPVMDIVLFPSDSKENLVVLALPPAYFFFLSSCIGSYPGNTTLGG